MKETKIERTARFFDSMSKLGFTYSEATALRRIELTLQRWGEKQCGDGSNWAIERCEETPNFQLINWPDASGNVWLVENRGTNAEPLYNPIREFQTKDTNHFDAKSGLRRELAKYIVGKPYSVYHGEGKPSRYPIADREAGALNRLAKIMATHPELWSYHQGDPRGCALYIGRKSEVNGHDLGSVYNRGFGVCI